MGLGLIRLDSIECLCQQKHGVGCLVAELASSARVAWKWFRTPNVPLGRPHMLPHLRVMTQALSERS
jgi:hypothetical protein